MTISHYPFRLLVFIVAASILLTSCHSYYTIPKDDYSKIEEMNDVKVVYTNGKEFVVEKDDTTNIDIVRDSLVVSQGSEQKIIGMTEIEKLKENRFDLGGTIALSLIGLTIFVILFFSLFSFKT